MLKITSHPSGELITLELEGRLAGPWVAELEACWRAASDTRRRIRVDLTGVTFVDSAGEELLDLMHQHGARFVAADCVTHEIVEKMRRRWRTGRRADRRIAKLSVAALLAILSLFAFSRVAVSQDRSVIRLTLREAVRLAMAQNPQLQMAAIDIAKSEQDEAIARSALMPQASLGMSEEARRLNIEANIGQRFPGAPQHSGVFQIFQAGPQFSATVFELTLWRRYQGAQWRVRATAAQAETLHEQIALLVVSQYLGSLRADADVRAARSRVDLAQALYDQASDLQKAGVGTGIDTLRANVQLQTEKQRLITSETRQKTLFFGLARLLNLDPLRPIDLSDSLRFADTPEPHAELALQLARAWETRPEMKALSMREQAAQSERLEARDARLPSVQATGIWMQQGLSASSVIPAYQYQVGITLPLFTGGRIRAEMKKADLELGRIAAERVELKNQIALEVKTAGVELESARHEVEVADLNLSLAQEEVAQARDRFQSGVANNIELVTAQDALARASDSQIGALYRYNQARADLARASGNLESLYSK